MKRFIACAAVAAAAGLAGTASADVTVTLTNQTFLGNNFALFAPAGSLTGTLTGLSINVVLEASGNFTYADDLTVIGDTATDTLLQVGGFSNYGALERQSWPNGASDDVGTTSIGTVTLTTPIDVSSTPVDFFIGNGYNGGPGTTGTWSGTVTLHGVSVPTPGAASLLGLGGLVALRRRR